MIEADVDVERDRALADVILEYSKASKSGGRRRIMVLGPYATRVNFHRQQNRALNLVWALSKQGQVSGDVAVIGKGVAGMTAAVALVGINWSVTLYDSDVALMPRQESAPHRVAHPTVNFWPEVDLAPSTDFPFLNWVAADCQSIANDLKLEWKQWRDQIGDRSGHLVTDLVAVRDKVEVHFAGGKDQAFDYVILASGFETDGRERPIPSNGYWDGIVLKRPTLNDAPVFVSGAGDGGLLEALRLSHVEFDAGRLVISAAQLLRHGNAGRRIEEGEAAILIGAQARALDRGVVFDHETDFDDGEAVTARKLLYEDVLETSVTDGFRSVLDRSLNPKTPSVYLICGKEHPYLTNASPIHKLMLAHAIKNQRVVHFKARIGDDGALVPPQPGVIFDPQRAILRHGAGFNLSLLTEDERADLRSRQGEALDKTDKQVWDGAAFATRLPREGEELERFVRQHANRAGRMKDLQPAINIGWRKGDCAFHYTVVGDRNSLRERPLPESMFGIALSERPVGRPGETLV